MRTIELTKVTRDVQVHDEFSSTDEIGENQGGRSAPVAENPKVVVNVDAIRCFYPRNDNRPGTRITFLDGGGFPVTEDFATVKSMVTPN